MLAVYGNPPVAQKVVEVFGNYVRLKDPQTLERRTVLLSDPDLSLDPADEAPFEEEDDEEEEGVNETQRELGGQYEAFDALRMTPTPAGVWAEFAGRWS